jgi:hypothetical protein
LLQPLAHFRPRINIVEEKKNSSDNKMDDLSDDEFGDVDFVSAASKKAVAGRAPTSFNLQRQDDAQHKRIKLFQDL